MTKPHDGNVASRLAVIASAMPNGIAIAQPSGSFRGGPVRSDATRSYSITTFESLDQESTQIAKGLNRWGIEPGMRIAMLVPFGAQFIQLTFALLKAGATVILIDPGIGRKHLVNCLSQAKPDGFMAIPKAQGIRTVLRKRFPDAKWNVTVGRRWFWGGKTLAQIQAMGRETLARETLNRETLNRETLGRETLGRETLGREAGEVDLPSRDHSDPAAIIFTTGSTGPPKGVLYTHGTFHAQIDRIADRYGIERGSRDLACFPLFGLFDAVMGVTTIIPDMDPTRPADVDPQRLVEAAAQWEVDQSFGSPALWNTVVRWAEENQVEQPFPYHQACPVRGRPLSQRKRCSSCVV